MIKPIYVIREYQRHGCRTSLTIYYLATIKMVKGKHKVVGTRHDPCENLMYFSNNKPR